MELVKHLNSFIRVKLNCLTSYVAPPQENDGSKKRVLLVHCHPNGNSFSAQLAKAVEKGLLKGGHDVRVRHLYSVGYDTSLCYDNNAFHPPISLDEITRYHAPKCVEIRSKNDFNEEEKAVREAVGDLLWCNSVVFVYPTW